MNADLGVSVHWAAPDPADVTHPLLDSAERGRCARLRRDADRARHATARVLAKRAAGQAHGVPAERVRVVTDGPPTAGRPRLMIEGVDTPRHLSIAHAGDVVVVALAGTPCGVDVEQVAALADVITSDLVWSERELARLAAEPEPGRLELACRWWTGKEAALKAVGRGIVEDLTGIDASSEHLQIACLGDTFDMDLRSLPAPHGYCASLALVTSRRP